MEGSTAAMGVIRSAGGYLTGQSRDRFWFAIHDRAGTELSGDIRQSGVRLELTISAVNGKPLVPHLVRTLSTPELRQVLVPARRPRVASQTRMQAPQEATVAPSLEPLRKRKIDGLVADPQRLNARVILRMDGLLNSAYHECEAGKVFRLPSMPTFDAEGWGTCTACSAPAPVAFSSRQDER